jgi:hypothetical protein
MFLGRWPNFGNGIGASVDACGTLRVLSATVADSFRYAVLFSLAVVFSAAAQTAARTSGPEAMSTATVTSTAGTSTGHASATGNAHSVSSSQATSGGSSGGTTAAPSVSVPGWVLCPPSGASGMQPFLNGTELSCAP